MPKFMAYSLHLFTHAFSQALPPPQLLELASKHSSLRFLIMDYRITDYFALL